MIRIGDNYLFNKKEVLYIKKYAFVFIEIYFRNSKSSIMVELENENIRDEIFDMVWKETKE